MPLTGAHRPGRGRASWRRGEQRRPFARVAFSHAVGRRRTTAMTAAGPFDLAVRGGEVVTPDGRRRADVYVAGGRIAAVTAERHDAAESVDAAGLLVMPGMVDAHVHFMDPGDTAREEFATGSAAALRAGVT